MGPSRPRSGRSDGRIPECSLSRTSLPPPCCTVSHVLRSQHHYRCLGRECPKIFFKPAIATATVISYSLPQPPSLPRFTFKSPATINSSPLGFCVIVLIHVLDSHPVVWRQVTSHNEQAPLPLCQLTRDDVRAKLAYCLNCKDGGSPIEDYEAALVLA